MTIDEMNVVIGRTLINLPIPRVRPYSNHSWHFTRKSKEEGWVRGDAFCYGVGRDWVSIYTAIPKPAMMLFFSEKNVARHHRFFASNDPHWLADPGPEIVEATYDLCVALCEWRL